MRLLTFEIAGKRRLGAEWNGQVVDLQNTAAVLETTKYGAAAVADLCQRFPSCMVGYLQGGSATRAIALEALGFLGQLPADIITDLSGNSSILYSENQIKRCAPVPRPGKIICIGLNYRDHAIESNMPIPQEPVLFPKYSNTVIGPGDTIVLPPDSESPDYEAELVFIIGKTAHNVSEADALSYVAGYTCGHDVSARDYQIKRGGGQWMAGKTWDTFAPMGPVMVSSDELTDPHNLPIRCVLNGEVMQNSSTAQFIFNIPQAIAYLSRIITLEPGDCVFTGTPPGVGFARKPPVFLKDGDVTEIQIDGIGSLKNTVSKPA